MPLQSRKAGQRVKDKEQTLGVAKDNFPIVAIGASAGGLETVQAFFQNMPDASDIAFVIIQHFRAQHKSLLTELLTRNTSMTVRQIEDGRPLSPGGVYLTPLTKNVAIFNQRLHLMEPNVVKGNE